jgi:pimeloyl-ACP methyl ester carboxylesterase
MSRAIRSALWITLAIVVACAPSTASRAAETRIELKGLGLLGYSALAPGKSWKDGAILLVHGTMMHGRMDTIAHAQKALQELGHSGLAVTLSLNVSDRRGMADCAKPQTHRQHDAVAEIAAWVAYLKAQGANDITLFGFSRGGNQALRYMLEKPDPAIKRLVLLAPVGWEEMSVAGYRDAPAGSLQKTLAEAEKLAAAGRGDELMRDVRLMNCPSASASANAFLSYYRDDGLMKSFDMIGRVRLPTLVVTGTLDTVSPDIPKRLRGKAGPNVKIATVDGADHFFRDLIADEAAEHVAKFISGQ